jgi:DNA-binding NarL/FixJ family response regulator
VALTRRIQTHPIWRRISAVDDKEIQKRLVGIEERLAKIENKLAWLDKAVMQVATQAFESTKLAIEAVRTDDAQTRLAKHEAIMRVWSGGPILEALQKAVKALDPGWQAIAEDRAELTRREQEVYDLVARGKTSDEIAEKLHITTSAVRFHRQNIKRKTGKKGRDIVLLHPRP